MLLPIKDGKIDQNLDYCYILSLNKGKYYILVLYLTHIAQISDRSTKFVVERILRDPEETCIFMAPAIKGSFGTGSSGNCVQNKNYNYYLALVYGDKTIKYLLYFCTIYIMWTFEQKYAPANPTMPDKVVFTRVFIIGLVILGSLAVILHIDHYFSYNIGLSFQGPQKKKNALAFRPKEEKNLNT